MDEEGDRTSRQGDLELRERSGTTSGGGNDIEPRVV